MENTFLDGTCSCKREVYPRFMGAVEAILSSVREGYTSPRKRDCTDRGTCKRGR